MTDTSNWDFLLTALLGIVTIFVAGGAVVLIWDACRRLFSRLRSSRRSSSRPGWSRLPWDVYLERLRRRQQEVRRLPLD